MKQALNIVIAPPSPLFASTASDTNANPTTKRLTGCINLALTAVSPSKIAPSMDINKIALLDTLKDASKNNANNRLSITTSQNVGKISSFVNNAS